MIEVEFKIPIADKAKTYTQLCELGFEKKRRVRETDRYFDNDTQAIYKNGEALRVREVLDLDTNEENSCITFKGERLDTVSKTRHELETGIDSSKTGIAIFEALGYHIVEPQVIKERLYLENGEMHACLDTIDNLGSFLELELVISDNSELENAQLRIKDTLESLGHSVDESISTSYLGLLKKQLSK